MTLRNIDELYMNEKIRIFPEIWDWEPSEKATKAYIRNKQMYDLIKHVFDCVITDENRPYAKELHHVCPPSKIKPVADFMSSPWKMWLEFKKCVPLSMADHKRYHDLQKKPNFLQNEEYLERDRKIKEAWIHLQPLYEILEKKLIAMGLLNPKKDPRIDK